MLVDYLYKRSFGALVWGSAWNLNPFGLGHHWLLGGNVLFGGLMNMSLNLFPLYRHPIAWYFSFEKCQESVSHGPEECFICLSYRFSLNDTHYGLRAAEQAASNCIRSLKFFFLSSFSPQFSLQGVMQSNLGKRPGVAGAVICKRLLC